MPVSVAGHVAGYPTEGGGEAVQVVFLCRFAFRFQEELVLGLVRKRHDFRLDARTVARADALDLSVIQRGVGEPFAQGLHGRLRW